MPNVSVIVPIWGVEQYIEKCVRSLFNQTLEDIEYIFIDDCTPDNSVDILIRVLDDYPRRKKDVKILHNEHNLGQSATRKKGILAAQGNYVIHCDPDDWVENEWLEKLYKKAVSSNADIVWCDFTQCYENDNRIYIANKAEPTREDCMLKLINGKKWGSLCCHLVKREIAQGEQIIWPTWNYCEDLALIFQYITYSSNLIYIKESLYNYRYNTMSISGKRDRESVMNNIQGEINASLIGIDCCEKIGIKKIFLPYLYERVLKAKGRVFGIAINCWDACKLWHSFEDGLTLLHIWNSKLTLREKITTSNIMLYLYPIQYYLTSIWKKD